MTNGETRDRWGSRLGLVLAAAGNAIGIGNLLRFPGKAASNGGGAFMIPYVVCLLLFGLPMMWVAWSIGRHGGKFGHGSLPGMFHRMWKTPAAKYVGVLGLALPMVFVLYYTYIEAWCLGYASFSFTGDYLHDDGAGKTVHLAAYFNEFLGDAPTSSYFSGLGTAFLFMGITLVLNLWVLSRGVARGIELLAKVAIPLLFLFCVLLAVRVFTLPSQGEKTALAGLNFLWQPQFGKLGDFNVWMEAAGQIFFTLSIGFGSLECYASYLREDDDIALTGLTTAATNEFVEVIFGSLIAIPAAALFYGVSRVEGLASSTFGLGMISIPEILRSFPYASLFGGIWFLLLFFAAFTSSVAVAQPVMAFFQDELKITRAKSALWLGFLWVLGVLPVILFYKYGVLDELDFWAGTMGLVVVALVEAVLFAWIFGLERGWGELTRGSLVQVPRVFKFIVAVVTPILLLVILGGWTKQKVIDQGALIPRPKIALAVAEPADFAGTVEAGGVVSPEAKQSYEDELRRRVEEEGGDGLLRAQVRFGADSSVAVESLQGEGALSGVTDAAGFGAYLSSAGYRYAESSAAVERTVPVVLSVLYTTPYIWLARAVVAGFFVLFIVLVARAFGRMPDASPPVLQDSGQGARG